MYHCLVYKTGNSTLFNLTEFKYIRKQKEMSDLEAVLQ